VLATLIERYESRDYPTPDHDPADTMNNLLKTREVSAAGLAKATGISRSTISNILVQRRGISKANAVALSAYFGVSAWMFL
jgi:plasmid maintenance system antidote protein VapI